MAIDKKEKHDRKFGFVLSLSIFYSNRRHQDAIGKKGAYTGFSFPNLKFTTKIWNDYEIFGYDQTVEIF